MTTAADIEALSQSRYAELENKTVAGLTHPQEADLARFIRRIGGYVQGGGRATDVLDYDAHHFERAMALIHGEAEPESDAEAAELKRWKAKHSP